MFHAHDERNEAGAGRHRPADRDAPDVEDEALAPVEILERAK